VAGGGGGGGGGGFLWGPSRSLQMLRQEPLGGRCRRHSRPRAAAGRRGPACMQGLPQLIQCLLPASTHALIRTLTHLSPGSMRRGSVLTWSSESDSECAGSVDTTSVWWPAAASLTASDAARLVLPTPPLPLWPGNYTTFRHRNCAMWPVVTPGSTPLSLAPTKA